MSRKADWSKYEKLVLSELKELKEDIKDLSLKFNKIMYGNSKGGIIREIEKHRTLFYLYGIIFVAIVGGLVKLAFF